MEHLEIRPQPRPLHLATGSLACPDCDAPVMLALRSTPSDALQCPFCDCAGPLREFLSLAQPPRAPRVNVVLR